MADPEIDRSEMVSVNVLRDATLELTAAYEEAGGVSPADDYDDEPRVHPMAEAKYVLALAELATVGAVSAATVERRLAGSLERLEALSVRPTPQTRAWGLGFSVHDLPPDEPFVITTSMVVHALQQVAAVAPEHLGARVTTLRDEAVGWLLDGVGRAEVDGVRVPQYSPGLELPAYNVAAYWAGTLIGALGATHPRAAEVREVASTVLRARIPGVGWTYEPGSARADLLHTGYIGWGLLEALPRDAELEDAVLGALLQFSGVPLWEDVFDVFELDDALGGARVGRRAMRIVDDHLLAGFDKPARSWSVGEALVLLATLGSSTRLSEFCYQHLRTLSSQVVDRYLPDNRFRHSMHLAHGLAMTIRVHHQRARQVST